MKRRTTLAYIALLGTMLLWSSAFPGIKFVLRRLQDPYAIAMLRLGFASAGLLVAAAIMRLPLPHREDLGMIALTGVLGFSLYHCLLNLGMSYEMVSAGQGSFIISTVPIWTTLLARPYLGEKITPYAWGGMALGLSGVGLMSLDPSSLSFSAGSLIVLSGAVSSASCFVLQKRLLDRYRPLHVSIYVTIAGSLPILAYLPWAWEPVAAMDTAGWAAVAYLGLFPIGIGYFLNAFALSRLPANRSTQFLLMVPLFATVLAWLTLGDWPRPIIAVGGPMILGGILLGQRGASSEDEDSSEA